MSAQPEQSSRVPNPSTSQDDSLVTPELHIAVTCPRDELAKAVREMLDQPMMKQALLAAFQEPIVEAQSKPPSALKLAPTRSPPSGILLREHEATIEYGEGAASNDSVVSHVQREILKRALLETALTGLRHFSVHASLPSACREEIQLFAQGIARKEALTQSEIRAVVSDVIRSEHDRLQRQKEKLFKKLKDCASPAFISVDELETRITTASALMSVLMSISLLVDQPGARPEKSEIRHKRDALPRAKVVEALEHAVQELALSPQRSWTRAVFDGDFERADAITRLRERMVSALRFDGFNSHLPQFLTPQAIPAAKSAIATQLLGSQVGALGGNAMPRFSPKVLMNMASNVPQALAVTRVERELRAWTTSDSDPEGLLRDDLIGVCQQVPSALVELQDKLPAKLPGPARDLLQILCLLRLHGGIGGASYFASVACHHTADEARAGLQLRRAHMTVVEQGDEHDARMANEKLQTFLAQIPAAHPEDYVSLVEILAGWSYMQSDTERMARLTIIADRLNALATSVIYTNTKTFEEVFLGTASNDRRFDLTTLEKLSGDVTGFAEAAKVLRQPQVSAYMEPVTESLSNMLEVLQVQTLEPREQLKHLGRVKRALERQQTALSTPIRLHESTQDLHGKLRATHDRIQSFYESLSVRLPEYCAELGRELSEFEEAGDIDAFTRRIGDGVAMVATLGPSETSTEIEELIDSKVMAIVNTIGGAWEYELTRAIEGLGVPIPMAVGLGFNAVSDALSAGTWCSTQLDTLRDVFSASTVTNASVRINHIDTVKRNRREQLSSGFLLYPTVLEDYVRAAKERIENPAIRNPSMVGAAERFLELHLDLRGPQYREVRSGYEELRKFIGKLSKS